MMFGGKQVVVCGYGEVRCDKCCRLRKSPRHAYCAILMILFRYFCHATNHTVIFLLLN